MVNPQLANYIKTEEAQGYTEAQLRSTLLKQGYPQKDINEAINSNKSPSIPSPKKQSSARPTGITIIALLYMIFGGLGILYNIYGFFSSASLLGSIPVVGGILAGLSFFAIFINALTLAVGIGLWKLKKWARTATLIITIIGLVFSIILARTLGSQPIINCSASD